MSYFLATSWHKNKQMFILRDKFRPHLLIILVICFEEIMKVFFKYKIAQICRPIIVSFTKTLQIRKIRVRNGMSTKTPRWCIHGSTSSKVTFSKGLS
jgi:hypothetical protein